MKGFKDLIGLILSIPFAILGIFCGIILCLCIIILEKLGTIDKLVKTEELP